MRALLRSAEELRKSQQNALRGKGADELRKRLEQQRKAVRALAHLGRDILADEGRTVSDAVVERIAKTIDAAALDEGSRFLLRAGRLTDELDPQGFESLAGMAPSAPAKKSSAAPKKPAPTEARRRLQEAKKKARELAREAARAEREAERAEAGAAKARRAAGAARGRSDEAKRQLAEAEAALRDASPSFRRPR